MDLQQDIEALLGNQLSVWELAKTNYTALNQVRTKEVIVDGSLYKVQFNPARIISSSAKVDAKSIENRACFLCSANAPLEQKGVPFGKNYQILVNPFPIFPKHFTIPELTHTPQRLVCRMHEMLELAKELTDYVIFYNGPQCGASAPDHFHFQAGNKEFLPIVTGWRKERTKEIVKDSTGTAIWQLGSSPRRAIIIKSPCMPTAERLFHQLYGLLPTASLNDEPMINVLAWREEEEWIICLVPRRCHRPSCYAAEGEANFLISPASVDMGGVFITPLKKDFERLNAQEISSILHDVCLSFDEIEQITNSYRFMP